MKATERGQWGESLAAIHLERKDTRVLARNWRWNRFEIDLIAQEGPVWVFVEVKVRKWGYAPTGIEAVNREKQRRIIQAADQFLRMHEINAERIRFDIISIEYSRNKRRIEHFEDAFFCLP